MTLSIITEIMTAESEYDETHRQFSCEFLCSDSTS